MNRKNGYGEAVLGNWSASDANAAPGMVEPAAAVQHDGPVR